jgi:lysophospholipase L1-like esterase
MSAPATPVPPPIPVAQGLSPAKAFAFCFVPVAAGVGLAVAFHLFVVLGWLGTGSPDLNRMVALGERLDEPSPTEPTLVFIGDSVTVEGIDASIVARATGGAWQALNFGLNGADRAELDVIVPKVARHKPTAVCIVMRPLSIAEPPAVNLDGAHAYNLGGFAAAWPEGWIGPDTPGLPAEQREALTAPSLDSKLHFRTAIMEMINAGLRARLRSGVRIAPVDDWIAPYNLTTSIGGVTLDNHIRALDVELQDAIKQGTERHERDFERLVSHLAAAGIKPVLVASPIHPRLREAFGPTAERMRALGPTWASSHGGTWIDATTLLDETGFADGQHPNQKGREALSAFIGSNLPPPR